LAYNGDNATVNDAQTEKLDKLPNSFEAVNRVRCFTHTLQISAKALISPFATPPPKNKEEEQEEAYDFILDDDENEEGEEAEDEEDDEPEDDFMALLSAEEQEGLTNITAGARATLQKVCLL
jgi:hypothetical protein